MTFVIYKSLNYITYRIQVKILARYFQFQDEELVQEIIRTKNSELFGIIYDRYSERIFNKCYSFSHNKEEAADLTHDVFLKIFLKLHSFNFRSKFSTWVYSVTYNYCVDNEKKKLRQNRMLHLQETEGVIHSPGDSWDEEELFKIKVDQLKKLLGELQPQERSMLMMKYGDDHSILEIMEITGLSESAVKMRLKRSKEKIIKRYHQLYTHVN